MFPAAFGCSTLLTLVATAAESIGPDNLKEQADRWIEIEQRIAEEKNQWRADKEVLQTSLAVLQKEQAALHARAAANDLATAAFQGRLEQARAELANHENGHRALLTGCDDLERRIRALLPRLPEPLQDRIAAHVERLGRRSAEEPSSVADRTQAVVSILAAIDQFNNTLTLAHLLRPDAGGETFDIKVLYWGLATGYAIDEAGQHAWLLKPGANGWEWREAPELATAIKTLIDIHEKQKSPELIMLPAGVIGGAQ